MFACPHCDGHIKVEPAEYIYVTRSLRAGELPEGVGIVAFKADELTPSEKEARRTTRGATNRHVPLILGLAAITGAGYLVFAYRGFWSVIVGGLLLAFGIVSLKTTFFASDKEVRELTGEAPIGEDTKRKLKRRL